MGSNRARSSIDDRAFGELRELARRDTELEARANRLLAIDGDVAAIRARAEAIELFLAGYPAEEARRGEAARAAEDELTRRRQELATAEGELARARDDDGLEHARHAVQRALDHIEVAQARLTRAVTERDELEQEAALRPAEVPALAERAGAISAEVDDLRLAGEGIRSLVDWASHAHAELFVAVGQIATARELVIREANELATMLLGEPTYGSTAAQALARVASRG